MKLILFGMNKDLCPILSQPWSMMGQNSIVMFTKNVCIINNNIKKLIRNLVATHNFT